MAIHLIFVVALGFKTSFCGTEEYQTSGNLPYRILYYFMAMTGQRFMYYTGWCMSDAGCIACGISYQDLNSSEKSQKESKYDWDKVYSIKIWEIETGSAPVKMMAEWNHEIYVWLKHYVQNRVQTPGKKPGLKEQLMTMGVSAVWHGFYPYYYVMFFLCALLVELSKDIYRARILFSFIP